MSHATILVRRGETVPTAGGQSTTASAWSRLQRHIKSSLGLLVPELRDRFLLTRQFSNDSALFDAFFPLSGSGLMEDVVTFLHEAAELRAVLSPQEIAWLGEAHDKFDQLFNRADSSAPSLFEAACEDMFFAVGTIADLLETKAERFPETVVTCPLDRSTELLDIALPGRWLSNLLDAVLENTDQRALAGDQQAQVTFSASQTLDPDPSSCLMTFTSRGVRVDTSEPSRSKPGHLQALTSTAPSGVRLLPSVQDATQNTFELTIVVAGMRHR